MRMLIIFTSIVVLLCNVDTHAQTKKLVKSITSISEEDAESIKLSYDKKNRLTEVIKTNPGLDLVTRTTIEYDSSGKIIYTHIYLDGKYYKKREFVYNANTIKIAEYHIISYKRSSDGKVIETPVLSNDLDETLYLNDKGQLVKSESKFLGRVYNKTFSYDSKNRIIKLGWDDDNPDNREEMVYDNKNGIYSGINNQPWVLFFLSLDCWGYVVNNAIKISEYDDGETSSHNIAITYNSNDYPISVQQGEDGKIKIEYY